jgi:hypothetical protein
VLQCMDAAACAALACVDQRGQLMRLPRAPANTPCRPHTRTRAAGH